MERRSIVSESDAAEILLSIWEAAVVPGGWQSALARLTRAFDAPSAKAAVLDCNTGRARLLASHNIDHEISQRWQEGQGGPDLWAEAGLRVARSSGRLVATGAELVPVDEYRRSEIYREVSGPSGHEDCLSTATGMAGERIGFVSLYRGELFERSDLEAFGGFAKQIRRAIRLQATLLRRATGAASVGALDAPALVCDARGRIEAVNPEGERLLRAGNGVRAVHGTLSANHPADDRALQRAIRSAADTARGESAVGATALALRREGGPSLGATVLPVPAERAAAALLEMVDGPGVLVLLSDPERLPEIEGAMLSRLFGLTPAEAQTAGALARGETLAEHADRSQVSVETVRSRLKRVLHKTGARRQADLVRIVLTTASQRRRRGEGGD